MYKYIIGICDDENTWCEKAKEIILKYAQKTEREIEVLTFHTGDEILLYDGTPFHAIFMDIELCDESGIHVASAINKKWKGCAICYLTNYLFYATDTYQTDHIYFVLKEQFAQRVKEVFDKLMHLQEQKNKTLYFELIKGQQVCLSPEEILFFERETRRTYIHTILGTYETWGKLDDIEKQLPEIDFVRCHNSYIVYFPAVREIKNNVIIMRGNEEILISRSYRHKVKKAFGEWAATRMS